MISSAIITGTIRSRVDYQKAYQLNGPCENKMEFRQILMIGACEIAQTNVT